MCVLLYPYMAHSYPHNGLSWLNSPRNWHVARRDSDLVSKGRITFQHPISSLISAGLPTSRANGPWILVPEAQPVDS